MSGMAFDIALLKLLAMGGCFRGGTEARADGHQETSMEDLTEDIILNIMSKLSLIDVVNLSFVCKQWSHLPAWIDRIVIAMDKACPETKDSFIRRANQYLHHYVKLQSKLALPISLRSFTILFCFKRQNSNDIDTWITIAIQNGVSSLFIRGVCELHRNILSRDDEKYVFPWQKLHELPTALSNLALRACILRCCLTSKWVFLEVLDFFDVVVSEYDMDKIAFCFPNLPTLFMYCCKVPAKLTFRSGALTYLLVWYCLGLGEIDLLGAKALTGINYRGDRIDLARISSPMLTKLKLGFKDVKGDHYVFQNLSGDTVRNLSVFRERERLPPQSHLHGRMNSFLWLEELKLYSHPACSISHQTMTEILKACPVLTRLEMVPSCTIDDSENNIESDHVHYRHKCLKFIKISGFCGSRGNMEMTKFLIQVSEDLHHVVVQNKVEDKDYKYLKHSADWHGEQEPEVVKDILLELVKSEQLTFSCTQNIVQTSLVYKYQKLLKTFCL